ncbi:putative zinc finger protein 617 [Danaus plexippus plexippus]|uniref:Zinc finger protein 617 n=1 Tax=Danaus plexippus plexippus TaxID=278856 RepID=A0A212F9Y0_DANPL|nr:putative zinc finger protein 617 [Danaus plexippus plexippus]
MLPIFLLINRMASRRTSSKAKPMTTFKKESGNGFCRTCLSTKNLELIFSKAESKDKKSEELRLVTGLEIKFNDGLSQKICTVCIKTIKTALRFRRISKKTEKTLLSMTVRSKQHANPGTSLPKANVIKTEPGSDAVELKNDREDTSYDADCQNYDYYNYTYKEEPETSEREMQKPTRGRQKCLGPNGTYKCHVCGKEFRMKATYTAHLRFHTHYCVCEACGKRCRNNNQLQEHKRARHGLGKIHKCAYCEYSSATKEALIIHERRHTGERPYVCDHCGASFFRRSTLVQHIAIHLPEKNFQCDMCPKRLKSKKFLQIHKHNAHTGKRYGYLCSVCDHRFEKPNKVRAHTRRVHGLPDEQQGPIVRIIL